MPLPPPAASGDLFRRLRAASREAAGVPWYDPAGAAAAAGLFPPTLRRAVAELDRSAPAHLRCERCGVELVRGLQATVCVFCGAEPRRELPISVSFRSTAAYRNLLESLGLDGSELVTLNATSKDSSKAKDMPVEEVALSSLFDIELKWPREERKDRNDSSGHALPPNTHLNLSGVDLDNFFSEANAADAPSFPIAYQESFHEDAFLSKEIQGSSESRDMDDFDNIRSPKTIASAQSENQFDSSSGDWETGIQSSISVNSVSVPISTDLFDGPSISEAHEVEIDSSEEVKSQLQQSDTGQGQPSEGDKSYSFPTGDLSEDDLWQSATIDMTSSGQEVAVTYDVDNDPLKQSDTEHSKLPDNDNGHTSSTDDWTEDNLWQSADVNMPSSVNRKDAVTDGMANSLPYLSDPVHTKLHENDGGHTYHVDDWNQDDVWQSAEAGASSFSNQMDTLTYGFVDNDLWQGQGQRVSVSVDKVDGDPFDVWQDFTSSHGTSGILLDSLPVNAGMNTPSNEAAVEVNLTSAPEDMEFGDFLQSDSIPAVSLVQSNSLNLDDMQLSSFNSFDAKATLHSNTMPRGSGSGYGSATAVPQPDSSSQSSVEALLSQIPDLSFMLESKLCIPKTTSS